VIEDNITFKLVYV